MASRHTRTVERQFVALYAQVPPLACVGKCGHSCSSGVDMSGVERERLAEIGVTIAPGQRGRCPALSSFDTCTVYPARPMVCRLWGSAEALPCPHGCQPVDAGPLLSNSEALDLLLASQQLGGSPLGTATEVAGIRRMVADQPELADKLSAMIHGDAQAGQDVLKMVRVWRSNANRS